MARSKRKAKAAKRRRRQPDLSGARAVLLGMLVADDPFAHEEDAPWWLWL